MLGDSLGVRAENTAKFLYEHAHGRWNLRRGQLVLIDEASLAGTLTLDRLREQAVTAGAKLLLVGDHHQLAAIDAGGAFGLLARHGTAFTLSSLGRFRSRWEADATRALRAGETSCLNSYSEHGRVHAGPAETMHDAAYEAWRADTAAGRWIGKTRGEGGYMAVFQTDDPFGRKAHAASVGVG